MVGLSAITGIAAAQEASQEAEDQVREVVVTGSRIARRDYEANSPIVTVGSEAIKETGEVSLEMAIQQLPQLMPDMNANDPLLSNGGRAQLNLRGLGANRNLVLLDGRRMVSSDPTGSIDINTIPSTMIESVEIISGGASAVYGSDAISGVINFKTRDNFTGVEVDAQYGETTRKDAAQRQFAITMGSNFADDKGNAVVSLNYLKRDLALESSRPFFANANPSSSLPQGAYTVDATNLPTQAAVDQVFGQYGVAPRTVANTRSLGFNDDGTLFPTTGPIVDYKGPGRPYIILGPTSVQSAAGQYISLVQPLSRYAMFGKLHYNLSDHVQAYSQFYLTQNDDDTTAGPTTLSVPMAANNPFVPADLKTILASRPNPNAPFTFTQVAGELGLRTFGYRFTTYQLLTGLKGDLWGTRWKWDVYGSYGTTSEVFSTLGNTDNAFVQTLTLAADGGASQGCAFDPFGFNNGVIQNHTISAACQKLLARQPKDETDTSAREILASLGGPVVKLPAGDIEVSATAGGRGYGYVFRPDAASFNVLAGGGTNFAVYTNASDFVKEASLEVLLPILKDKPGAELLNIDVAGRYSDYRSTGGTTTYKADMEWQPLSPLRFRGGYERALRAPNPAELYGAATTVRTNLGNPPGGGDPCDVRSAPMNGPSAAALRALCVAEGVPVALSNTYEFLNATTGGQTVGNPNVKPEIADTYTLGVVWTQPIGVASVRTSLDFYDIVIRDAISSIPLQTIINKCYNLDGSNPTYSPGNFYCGLQSRNPIDGTIQNVKLANQNVGGFRTKGLDLETDVRFPLGIGTVLLNATLNYVPTWDVQLLPGTPWQSVNGEVVPTVSVLQPLTPKWRGLFRPSYDFGPFRVGARIQYIASMVDPTFLTNPATALPGVPAYTYYGVDVGWRIGKTYNLRAGIDNLLNKGPPVLKGTPGVTSPTTYDTVGRRFFVGVTADF